MHVEKVHSGLPIFALRTETLGILYTPGYATAVRISRLPDLLQSLACAASGSHPETNATIAELLSLARKAEDRWKYYSESPFVPTCLAVYLSNRCNLCCTYCYARSETRRSDAPVIRAEAVGAAASLVAEECAKAGRAFSFVINGGGEPTVHFELVRHLVSLTRDIARRSGVGWSGHITTNGMVSEVEAEWLAHNLDTIELSCDGPPDIHNSSRPLAGGGGSSQRVERVARVLAGNCRRSAVRATILSQAITRQSEIVAYCVQALGILDIRFEPAYQVRALHDPFLGADQAEAFVEHYLKAARLARDLGAELSYSGVRLDEIHGPYCPPLRELLLLAPDGSATACFFSVDSHTEAGKKAVIGRLDETTGGFVLDPLRIAEWRRRATDIPARCRDCICLYHCARECPEVCHGLGHRDDCAPPGFRCLVARKMCEKWIEKLAAAKIETDPNPASHGVRAGTPEEESRLVTILSRLPSHIDTSAILDQWNRVRWKFKIAARSLPKPVWAERGYQHDGRAAWEILKGQLAIVCAGGPISIYLHIPFCERRCPFCDCYSIVSARATRAGEFERFTEALLGEMKRWAALPGLASRRVTAVHFGGGTPNHLPGQAFARIVEACRSLFATNGETEFALESTSRLLGEEQLQWLRELGFTRLHVGVQTLEDPVRRLIGRQESAARVLDRLRAALNRGFVVSVDLVCGLPLQSPGGFIGTIEQLAGARVHGFSIYQLQESAKNRRFLERSRECGRDPLSEYVLFQCAEQVLTLRGYRKNHFAHFCLEEDRSLYYRHAVRGEDLLALGPTADGVFGSYHYRHPELNSYLAGTEADRPALEGGIRENEAEVRAAPLVASLMAGTVDTHQIAEIGGVDLLSTWRACGLIGEGVDSRTLILSGNGSWFIDDLVRQIRERAAQLASPLSAALTYRP